MNETRQWVKTCSNCGGSTQFYCNTCDLAYCEGCKEKHLNSEETRYHCVSPYAERVNKCPCVLHHGQDGIAWCETCGRVACAVCVTSLCGNGHRFKNLLDKVNEWKSDLKGKYDTTNELCSVWQNSLSDLDKKKGTLEKTFERLEERIKNQGSCLRNKVKQIEDSRLKQLQEHKRACLEELLKPQTILEGTLNTLRHEKTQYEDILRSNDVVKIFEFKVAKKSNEDTVPPRFTQPAVPQFRSGKINGIALDEIYSNLTLNGGGNNYANINGPAFETTHDHLKKAMSLPKNYLRRITSEEELSVIQTGRSQPSTIVCVGLGQAWMSTSNDTLKLVDKSSNFEEKTVTHKSFCDAGLTPFNEIVLLDSNAKAVLLLTVNWELSTLFCMKMKPFGICVLHNNAIIVTFKDDRKVMKFDWYGKELVEFDNKELDHPFYAAENKVTKAIFIINKTGYAHYDYPGSVKAFEENGEFLYEYDGSGDGDFTPVDACSDEKGHVFVTDYVTNRVHILNKDGKFMQFLEVKGHGLRKPCRIDINDSIYVWISENETEQLKVVRWVR